MVDVGSICDFMEGKVGIFDFHFFSIFSLIAHCNGRLKKMIMMIFLHG